MNLFTFDRISKSYSTGLGYRKRKQALANISLQIKHHEIFGIIGINGAGKSTTLKLLMGFIRPDKGTILINDVPVTSITNRKDIGYLPENPSLYSHLNITEHLRFSCKIASLSSQETRDKIEKTLETVGLSHVSKTPLKQFSKGMTQRAALAYAIILEPKILILDEPMSGLDPLGRQLVIDIIHDYRQRGSTILFCSHILTDVERICDRIGIMHEGQLKSILSTDDLHKSGTTIPKNNTPLEQAFFNIVRN